MAKFATVTGSVYTVAVQHEGDRYQFVCMVNINVVSVMEAIQSIVNDKFPGAEILSFSGNSDSTNGYFVLEVGESERPSVAYEQTWTEDSAQVYVPACAHCERRDCPYPSSKFEYDEEGSTEGYYVLTQCSGIKYPKIEIDLPPTRTCEMGTCLQVEEPGACDSCKHLKSE
jgi:hypothetical protein